MFAEAVAKLCTALPVSESRNEDSPKDERVTGTSENNFKAGGADDGFTFLSVEIKIGSDASNTKHQFRLKLAK